MKNYIRVDDKSKRLVMDRTFDRNRKIVGSREYTLLQMAKPGDTILFKGSRGMRMEQVLEKFLEATK